MTWTGAKKRDANRRRGTAVVELAVIMPFVLAMVFGIIEFGWLFTAQHTLVNAAREGARVGCLQGSTVDEIEERAREMLAPMGLDDLVTIEVTEATPDDPFVTVQITVPREEVSLVGDFFGFEGGTLQGTATMRKEGM